MSRFRKYPPILPGKILKKEFLDLMGVTQTELARATGVSRRLVNEIVRGKRTITPETALRFAAFFGNAPAFWMEIQSKYDLKCAKDHLGGRVREEVESFCSWF